MSTKQANSNVEELEMRKKLLGRNLCVVALGTALAVGTTGCGLNFNLGNDSSNDDIDFGATVEEYEPGADVDFDDSDINFDDEEVPADDFEIDDDEEVSGDDGTGNNSDDSGSTPGALVTSTLSAEAEGYLASLQSDYGKINWGVRYSVGDEYSNFVISIAPYMEDGEYNLIVAFTNLYDTPISFSGTANVLGTDDEVATSASIYTPAVGSGNTVFEVIPCGSSVLDGRIRWENCSFEVCDSGAFVPWEADYASEGNPADGYITMNYSISSSTNTDMVPNNVTFMVLDASGNVIAIGTDYVTDTVAAGTKYDGSVSIFASADVLSAAKGVAMFADSLNY